MLRRRIASILFGLVLLAAPKAWAAPLGSDGLPKITVQYYYCNACGACDESGQFEQKFFQTVGDAGNGVQIELLTYNTFQSQDDSRYRDACDKYGVPAGRRVQPMLVINGKCLLGGDEIDRNLKAAFMTEKARLLYAGGSLGASSSTLLYFYISPCEECADAGEFIGSLDGAYTVSVNGTAVESRVNIAFYNVSEEKNLALVRELFKRYGVPDADQKAPIVFLKETYLSGRDAIENRLIGDIRSGKALGTAVPDAPAGREAALKAYDWPGIFLTGLVNGFNPCSVSMLLFLITLLLARNASVLKLGLAFIAGKSAAYLALGTAFFSLFAAIDNSLFKALQLIVKYVLLAAILAIAAANVSDFVAARNERYNKIRLQLPEGLRRLNHRWIRKLAGIADARLLVPVMLALGALVSVGEFLCTGQIYLATIIYMLKRSSVLNLQVTGAFVLYVLGMTVPLLLITLAIWKGREVFNLTELARRNMPLIKLINAGIFVIFGALLVFNL